MSEGLAILVKDLLGIDMADVRRLQQHRRQGDGLFPKARAAQGFSACGSASTISGRASKDPPLGIESKGFYRGGSSTFCDYSQVGVWEMAAEDREAHNAC